jgi:hypothetical protein
LGWSDPDSGSNLFHFNICIVYEFFLLHKLTNHFLISDYTHICFPKKLRKAFKVLQLQLFKRTVA